MAADSSSSELATGKADGSITLWDVQDWKVKGVLKSTAGSVQVLKYGAAKKGSKLPQRFLLVSSSFLSCYSSFHHTPPLPDFCLPLKVHNLLYTSMTSRLSSYLSKACLLLPLKVHTKENLLKLHIHDHRRLSSSLLLLGSVVTCTKILGSIPLPCFPYTSSLLAYFAASLLHC